MASYNTVITNEGAALLASVIANQGTLTFSEMRFSTTDYDGVEQTLTVGTFGGVFITAAAAGSVVDATTIKVAAQFDNSGIVGDHPLYSIGIVGTDGNTTALIAVCTTTNPDIIRAALTGVSTYAFNVNLTVSSTSDITVVGTTAAVLYDTDIVDNLTTADATKVLSANMGHAIADNLAANENVYGAKNQLKNNLSTTTVGDVTYTVNDDKSITVSGTPSGGSYVEMRGFTIPKGVYILSGIQGYTVENMKWDSVVLLLNGSVVHSWTFGGVGTTDDVEIDTSPYTYDEVNVVLSRTYPNVACSGTVYPMLRDARILDPTFVPFAKTNQQLTVDKAERSDLATLNLTGSTNTTGAQIDAGTFFYLNGTFCKALANIAVNAAFTENTNYKKTDLGKELPNTPLLQIANAGTSYTIYRDEPYGYSSYCVRNGLVFVNIIVLCNSPEANWSKVCDLPKSNYLNTIDIGPATNYGTPFGTIPLMLQNGELFAIGGVANVAYRTSFCYPI